MKKLRITQLVILILLSISLSSQVAINTDETNPDASAMLDVKSTNSGVLIPRMLATERDLIPSPAIGLLVYVTDDDTYYYNSTTGWVAISTPSTGWTLTGNSGTWPSTNFIGTIDNTPLAFRVNNQLAGKIDQFKLNTSFGYSSLTSNTIGNFNTAIGHEALYSNTEGSFNTANGYRALYTNTVGESNTAIGLQALYSNTSGNYNTATGVGALYYNTMGTFNTAIGYSALFNNTTGFNNTAMGYNVLYSNITGLHNTATGYQALYSNTDGDANTAIGVNALYYNTTGDRNTAMGVDALYYNTTGSYNTAIGELVLYSNTDGEGNTAIGAYTLHNNNGNDNTACGKGALSANSTGYFNTAIGANANSENLTGNNNTSVGQFALRLNTTGSNNSALGQLALYNSDGTYMTGLGHGADAPAGVSNSTVIGDAAIVNTSAKVRIGDGTMTVIEGQVAWSYPSDGRFKLNVTEEVKGLDFIKLLRPVVYNFDTRKYTEFLTQNMPDSLRSGYLEKEFGTSTAIRQSGFVAQEVVEAANRTGYDFNGVHAPETDEDNYSIAYSQFVVPLVKAVQEQQEQIESQLTLIEQLVERIELLENR